jgi:hypothetical protein
MVRSLIWFVILLALFGVGAVWMIEKGTGEQVVSHRYSDVGHEAREFYLDQKARLLYWWSRMTGPEPTHVSPVRNEKPETKQPPETLPQSGIVKWRDAQGTWHFADKQPEDAKKDHR